MPKVRVLTFVLFASFLFQNQLRAEEIVATPFKWAEFRLSGIAVSNSTGDSASFLASWNPEFQLGSIGFVRANVGVSRLKNGENSRFWVGDFGVFGGARYRNFELEAALGAQTWGDFGTFFSYGSNLLYRFETPLFEYLNRILVSYRRVGGNAAANVFGLGIGIGF